MATTDDKASSAHINVPFPDPMPQKIGSEQAEAWPRWLRRFERFRAASGLNSKSEYDKIEKTLFYAFGPAIEDILVTVKVDETKSTYDEVIKTLDSYFGVRKNPVVCHARFNTRIQRQNESVDSFIQDLYRLADDCGYGTMRDILICDRIVVGVNDEALSDRMQINKNLKLEDAVEMARQSEARKQNRDLVRGGNVQTTNSLPDKNVDLVKRQQSTYKFKQKQRYSNSGSKGPIQTHSQSKEHAKTCPW